MAKLPRTVCEKCGLELQARGKQRKVHEAVCAQLPPPRDMALEIMTELMLVKDYYLEHAEIASQWTINQRFVAGKAILREEQPRLVSEYERFCSAEKGRRISDGVGEQLCEQEHPAETCLMCGASLTSKALLQSAGRCGNYCGWCAQELYEQMRKDGRLAQGVTIERFAAQLSEAV